MSLKITKYHWQLQNYGSLSKAKKEKNSDTTFILIKETFILILSC